MKPLTQQDEALLCGREREVREIVANCHAERLSVVTGDGGLGLTSLLEAGVAPVLRREGAIVAVFRDWQGRFFVNQFKEAIAEAVREQADPGYFAQGEPLDEMLHSIRARTGRHVAVLLDQFEDYVRCHAGTDISDTFDAELAHAVACREGQFVIAIQEHAIPAFERMRQHIPNLLGFQINLAPLTEDAAREAVRRAARARDLEMEEGTLDAIVRSRAVARTPGMAHPFFLMTAATQLFDAAERVKSKLIGAAVLEQYGGPDRVVFESLDSKIAELGTSHTELLFRWCNILISPDKRRLAVTEKGLADYAGRLNRFVLSLLPMVTEANILRSFETPEAIRYEIARESLTPILRDWWERREAVLVARRRAIFRTTSVSLAVGAIVAVYIVWLLLSKK